MFRLSRAVRRLVVIGAVAALGAVIVAPPAASGENGNNSLDPPGVDVPGWEAEKVSGEAEGCWSEIELTIDPEVILVANEASSSDVSGSDVAAEGFADALTRFGGVDGLGYLGELLNKAQEQVDAYLSSPSSSEVDDVPGIEVFHQEVGPLPEVEIPWQGGGPVKDDEEECTLDLFGLIPIPLATDLAVESEGLIGPAGYAHTESESHDNLGLIYFADKIDSECLATLEDIDAKTDIEDGEYLFISDDFSTIEVRDLPEHPEENEELVNIDFSDPTLFGGVAGLDVEFELTANEQEETDKAVDVTAIHSEFLISITVGGAPFITLTVEGFRDKSHCDIHPIETGHVTPAEVVVVEPKFTG